MLSQFTSAPNQGLGQEAGRKPKGAVAGSAQARAGGVSDAGELVAAFDAAPRPAQTAQTTEGVRAGSFNLSTEKSCDRGQPPAFLSNTAGSNLQNGVFDGNSSSINSRNSPPYTSSANSRLGEIERVEFQLVGCRCKSSSCSRCGPLKGWRLSQELAAELERFKFPQLWTLTVDPAACPDPRKIYDHLVAKRATGHLVRSLHRLGLLESKEYFVAVEFQMGKRNEDGTATEQVHFHLIVDAKGGFLDHAAVSKAWDKFRPEWANVTSHLPGRRPGMLGFVQFEVINNCEGIAIYACKYASKGPAEGLPTWFEERIDEGHNCVLYRASRGFWIERDKRRAEKREKAEDVAFWKREVWKNEDEERIWYSNKEDPDPQLERERFKAKRPRRRKKLVERHAACGKQAALIKVIRYGQQGVEGWGLVRHEYKRTVGGTFEEMAAVLGADEVEARRMVIPLDPERWELFRQVEKENRSREPAPTPLRDFDAFNREAEIYNREHEAENFFEAMAAMQERKAGAPVGCGLAASGASGQPTPDRALCGF